LRQQALADLEKLLRFYGRQEDELTRNVLTMHIDAWLEAEIFQPNNPVNFAAYLNQLTQSQEAPNGENVSGHQIVQL
jgi:hypothetical protein